MFSLPTACITLKTDSHFLPYFAKCSSVVYVDLLIVDYYPAKSPLYDKAIVPSLNLRAMILKFTRKDEYSNINIWKSIVNAVKGMKSLKVLRKVFRFFSTPKLRIQKKENQIVKRLHFSNKFNVLNSSNF